MVEALVAAVVLIVFLGAVVLLVVRQGSERKALAERSLATTAALDRLERLHGMTNAEIAALDGTGFDVLGPMGQANGLTPVDGDADGLPGEFTVSTAQSSGTAKLFRVTATVRWKGTLNQNRLQLSTLLGERK